MAQLARDRLEREIASRGRLLSSAQEELAGLGWLGRRRHRPALREVIDLQARAVADLRLELRDLPAPEDPARAPALKRSTAPITRKRAIERSIGLER